MSDTQWEFVVSLAGGYLVVPCAYDSLMSYANILGKAMKDAQDGKPLYYCQLGAIPAPKNDLGCENMFLSVFRNDHIAGYYIRPANHIQEQFLDEIKKQTKAFGDVSGEGEKWKTGDDDE